MGSHRSSVAAHGAGLGSAPRVLEGNSQNVNGVAFSPDGRELVSAGYDTTLRIWPLAGGAEFVRHLPTPLNSVAVAPDGEIVAAGATGKVFFLSPKGEVRAEVEASAIPIIALPSRPTANWSPPPASAARWR